MSAPAVVPSIWAAPSSLAPKPGLTNDRGVPAENRQPVVLRNPIVQVPGRAVEQRRSSPWRCRDHRSASRRLPGCAGTIRGSTCHRLPGSAAHPPRTDPWLPSLPPTKMAMHGQSCSSSIVAGSSSKRRVSASASSRRPPAAAGSPHESSARRGERQRSGEPGRRAGSSGCRYRTSEPSRAPAGSACSRLNHPRKQQARTVLCGVRLVGCQELGRPADALRPFRAVIQK